MTKRRESKPRRAVLVHFARCVLLASLLLAIPAPLRHSEIDAGVPPPLDSIPLGPKQSAQIEAKPNTAGLWRIFDDDGETVGMVARTFPAAKDVVGYRGPTESVILLDSALNIVAVGLLQSSDTQEHVDAVINDQQFFDQFRGWSWGGPPPDVEIDGVSSATLTSLALAEGVIRRIGGHRPSLFFPDELSVSEVEDWFPEAALIQQTDGTAKILAANGNELGRVIRSGPWSDDIIGYQGPSELLIRVGSNSQIESLRLRNSYDNEPYVDHVRTERGFWNRLEGRTIAELAHLDPIKEGIEGVSGATMTSMAVADTLVATARTEQAIWARWTVVDIASIMTLLMAACLSRLSKFRVRWLRRLWLILVIGVIGFWAGNLISLALVAGWSAEGIAWRLAPGLTAIAATALLVPPVTKANPYCNHLCPHGAMQQLIKPSLKSRRHWHLSASATNWLTRMPGATLVIAYLALVAMPSTDLSSWEPFHAYLFRIAGWGSIGLAALSLSLATVIPMGYCRLGCPTGRLIHFLRRSATSGEVAGADYVAVGLLVVAIFVRAS